MKNIIYLAVTPDKYELPIALFENLKEACLFSNKSEDTFYCSVCRKSIDRKNKCRYVSVKLTENEE